MTDTQRPEDVIAEVQAQTHRINGHPTLGIAKGIENWRECPMSNCLAVRDALTALTIGEKNEGVDG